MPRSDGFSTGAHVVFKTIAPLVFRPKYRRHVLTPRVFAVLDGAWREACVALECTLVESNDESDHVHLLVAYPPKVSLSTLAHRLKGLSSRRIRQADLPDVTRTLWGDPFWSPSYCVVSCGGVPLETIKRYIQNQVHSLQLTAYGPLCFVPRTLLPALKGRRGFRVLP